jgi:hypothetical protein
LIRALILNIKAKRKSLATLATKRNSHKPKGTLTNQKELSQTKRNSLTNQKRRMEYSGIIQNCTFILYNPNITPIEHFLPLPSIVPFAPFASIEPFIPFASIESAVSSITSIASIAYITSIASIAYITSITSIAYIDSIAYIESIEPLVPFASIEPLLPLLPLALLAFLTLITLLITYKNTQYISEEDELSEISEISGDEISEDELIEDELNEDDKDYTSSIIEESIIVNRDGVIVSDNKKFRGILVDIWKTMEKQDILDNTTFKFKSGNKRGVKGYNFCEGINMSFQNRDSNATLKEILRMVKLNNLAIYLSIKLETGEIVYIIE